MRQLLVHVLVFFLVLGSPGALLSGDLQWIGQPGEKKWDSQFELGLRPGSDDRYNLEVDPFIPIAQDDVSLWFLNLRNSFFWVDSDTGYEFNLGGGYRRIFDNRWILGGYGYFDHIKSRFDNQFNQVTLGMEALSLDWDLRLNGYIADDEQKAAPDAGRLELVGTQLSMSTGVEQALSGFDVELGWRLPFDPDSLLGSTRVYAGGFYFDASEVSSISGPRVRLETRLHDGLFWDSRLTLGTEYRWDDVRGSQVTGLLSLRIPFGAPPRSRELTRLERRMTDRVVRDVRVVTNVGNGGNEPVRNAAGAVIGEALFFDQTGGGDGSFALPLDLPTAIPTGGQNALLIGLDSTGDITGLSEMLLDGQTVLGGGTSITLQGANSGNTAVFTPAGSAATFTGGVGPTLTLGLNNTVSGLTFRGVSTALRINQSGGSSITNILGNTFDTVGVGLDANLSGSFDATLNLRDSTFLGGGSGLSASLAPDGSAGPSSFDLDVSQNSFDSLASAIGVSVSASGSEDYTHRSSVSDNLFSFNGSDYELDFDGGGAAGFLDIDVTVDSNESTSSGSSFANVYVGSAPSGHVDLEIANNQIDDAGDHAIAIYVYDGPDLDVMIANNQIDTAGGDGIHVDVYSSGSLDGHSLTINDNAMQYISDDGIDVYFGYGHDATTTIANNTIAYVYGYYDDGDGIAVDFYGNGHDTGNVATINGNTIAYVNDDGINVYSYYSSDANVTVSNNTIQYAYADGIAIDFYATGHDVGNVATINGNTIHDVSDNGIDVYFGSYYGYGYDAAVTISGNDIQYAYGDGIAVDFYAAGHDLGNVAAINGNTIQDVSDNGIDVYFGYGHDTTVTIADNEISDAGGDGIYVYSYYNGHDLGNSLTINRNTIQDVGGSGIYVYSYYYNLDTSFEIADNTIVNAGDDGIRFYSYYYNGHDVGDSLTISGNTIQDVGDDGIDVYFYWSNLDEAVTISDNTIRDAGDDGIYFYSYYYNGYYGDPYGPGHSLTVSRNDIDRVGGGGIDAYFVNDYRDTNVTIADNTIQDVYGEDGIQVYLDDVGHNLGSSVSINGNDVTNVYDDGIDVYVYNYYGSAIVTIADNTIDQSGLYGIDVDTDAATTLSSSLGGPPLDNVVTNFGVSDTDLSGGFSGSLLVNGVVVP